MKIRQAEIDDLKSISNLFNAYRIFYGEKSDIDGAEKFIFERFKNLDSIIFIAETDEGNAIGFAQLYPSFSSVAMKKVYILNDLFVNEKFRKQGAGFMLLKNVLSYVEKFNCARVTLTTEVSNKNAQSLYEKVGFKFDEENKVYHFFVK